MSYDILIYSCDDEDEVLWEANMTSNLVPMWRLAGADLATFHGRTTADVVSQLENAIAAMRACPERYRPLNPPNGWGDYGSCLEFLESIHAACVQFRGRNRIGVCH